MKRSFNLSEDYTAIVLAFTIIGVVIAGVTVSLPSFSWNGYETLVALLDGKLFLELAALWLFGLVVVSIALLIRGTKIHVSQLFGYTFIFFIAILSQLVTGNATVKGFGFEVVLFSLLIGLFISNVLNVPKSVRPLIQTELFIKIGLVLLGSGIIFKDVLQAGALGLIQSIAVVFVVWHFSFWLCKKFKLDDDLRAMLSSAVAICGVSAAIATAGAVKGDSKKLSYVISLVLITAVPMMLVMPYIAKATEMSAPVAGAWMGGTIDTTGAVVAAGKLLGEEGLKYATVVKFSQNVLLGLAAFAISIYWAYSKNSQQERPSAKDLWDRFPKFVLGFLAASILFSFFLSDEIVGEVKSTIKEIQTFWFALAFVCIGLETKFEDVFRLDGGRPAFAFLIAQTFNIFFTLLVAYLVFELL